MASLFVDRLTVIDASYLDRDRGLVGESWIVDLELGGVLDDQGMVFDFSSVKKTAKRLIDNDIDHKLIVPKLAAELLIDTTAEQIQLHYRLSDTSVIVHTSPVEALCLLDAAQVSASIIADTIETSLREHLPDNINKISVVLRQEQHSDSYYHYSHGLKKHEGNCQRIAHGHRSKIIICINGQRATQREVYWAKTFRDIYIATEADVTRTSEGNSLNTVFSYSASQGSFQLSLPTRCVYVVNSDTTVELIARHIADCEKTRHPDASIRVKAFEGVEKGAICER